MTRDIKQHPLDYILLWVVLLTQFILWYFFQFNTQVERIIIISTGVSFFVWGLWHHKRNKDLDKYIVFEYATFAIICILLALNIT